MNETVQLLQDVVRNARTGLDAVSQLEKRAEGERMRAELRAEARRYEAMARDGAAALREAGGEPEPSGAMARAGMWMGIEMETLTDRSDAHIAEVVVQGANMGVIEMTKSLNSYGGADSRARDMANGFVNCQNQIIERQKGFLKN